MKFIGVLQMVKGLGPTGVTIEELFRIAVAVYLLKQKGEVLPKSNSAFYLLKSEDPDKWENFKEWNILKATPKFQEPRGDTSETTEDDEEVEDPGLENSPPNKVNVEEQASSTGESGNNPNQDTEEDETMTNVSSMESYKPSNDSSTSIVNIVSHASRPKKHLCKDAVKAKLQSDKQREAQTKLLSEMHNTMKDSKKQSAESLMMMQLKSYYKMCKHCGNDEGCDAAMDAMCDLLNQSGVLPIVMVQTTANDKLTHDEQEVV